MSDQQPEQQDQSPFDATDVLIAMIHPTDKKTGNILPTGMEISVSEKLGVPVPQLRSDFMAERADVDGAAFSDKTVRASMPEHSNPATHSRMLYEAFLRARSVAADKPAAPGQGEAAPVVAP